MQSHHVMSVDDVEIGEPGSRRKGGGVYRRSSDERSTLTVKGPKIQNYDANKGERWGESQVWGEDRYGEL